MKNGKHWQEEPWTRNATTWWWWCWSQLSKAGPIGNPIQATYSPSLSMTQVEGNLLNRQAVGLPPSYGLPPTRHWKPGANMRGLMPNDWRANVSYHHPWFSEVRTPFSASRVTHASGDTVLPRSLTRLNPRQGAPVVTQSHWRERIGTFRTVIEPDGPFRYTGEMFFARLKQSTFTILSIF